MKGMSMAQTIFNALLITSRVDPPLFAEVVRLTGGERSPLEFNAPQISRLPWEETYRGAYGTREFTAEIAGGTPKTKVILTLEPITKGTFRVGSIKTL
jgi:hypothetical protein